MPRILTLLVLVLFTSSATAYVGPGAGISVLGSLLGILATIFVAIGAILIWPVRKFMKRRKARKESEVSAKTETSGADN